MKYIFVCIYALCIGCVQETTPPIDDNSPQVKTSSPQLASTYSTDSQLFEEGRSLQARADFSGAESRYRQAIAAKPDNPQYNYYLGTVLHATSRYGEARGLFEKVIELKPDYAAPRIALGKLLYDVDGNSEAACNLLREAISFAPQASEARYTLALIHLREGQSDEAIRLFSNLVKIDSSNTQARIQLGLAYLQQGDMKRAQSELKRATVSKPYHSAAFHGLGQTFIRQGKTEAGQRLLKHAQRLEEQASQLTPHQNALRQNPDQPQAHYNLASMYARFNRLRLAAQHFSQAITLDSTHALAYQGLGNLYLRLGTTPESRVTYVDRARALYLRALQLNPQLAETHNNLGLLLHSSGDVQNAVQHYKQATLISPRTDFYQANLSRGYLDLEQFSKAIEAADLALHITPTMSGARETLGDIYAAQKDWTKALEEWKKISVQNASSELTQKIAQARKQSAP